MYDDIASLRCISLGKSSHKSKTSSITTTTNNHDAMATGHQLDTPKSHPLNLSMKMNDFSSRTILRHWAQAILPSAVCSAVWKIIFLPFYLESHFRDSFGMALLCFTFCSLKEASKCTCRLKPASIKLRHILHTFVTQKNQDRSSFGADFA